MEENCRHAYKELDAEVIRTKADNETVYAIVDAVFYCDKCLDIQHIFKRIEKDVST